MSEGLRIAVVAGVFAIVAAFLLGGRYSTVANPSGIAVIDRFTGAVYVNGTSLHLQQN